MCVWWGMFLNFLVGTMPEKVDKAEVVLYNRSKKNDKGDRDAFLG